MSITLTTPFQQPSMHGQPASVYNEIKIIAVGINLWQKEIAMTCQYGNTVSDDWVPGIIETVVHIINNKEVIVDADGNLVTPADPEFDLFISSEFPSSLSTPIYDDVETVKLGASMRFMGDRLGFDHPVIEKVLGERNPDIVAQRLPMGRRLRRRGP